MADYHARLSPSSAHRWMHCAGAPRLEATVPQQPAGPHADLGTAAHEIAETILREGYTREHNIASVESWPVDGRDVEIGQDTRDAIWQYVTAIRDRAEALGIEFHLEGFVSLAPLNPPPGLEGGTVDCWMYDEANRHLYVDDYKNGYTPVDGKDNEQMRLYALGVVVQNRIKPETITTTIHQPRSRDEDVKPDTFTWAELVEFKREAFEAARAANDPDAPVGPVGSHCKWCRAKAICPAQLALAQDVAREEFTSLPVLSDTATVIAHPAVKALPEPSEITQDRMLKVLEKASIVEDWFKAVRDYAKAKLEAGEEVPGWKLVEKRATRKWRDEEAAEEWLKRRLPVADVYKKQLVSPYQAEQAIKREFVRLEVPEEFIISESSGVNMVPEDHPKPAVQMLTAKDVFDAS